MRRTHVLVHEIRLRLRHGPGYSIAVGRVAAAAKPNVIAATATAAIAIAVAVAVRSICIANDQPRSELRRWLEPGERGAVPVHREPDASLVCCQDGLHGLRERLHQLGWF